MCKISVHYQENLPDQNESYKTRHFAVDLNEELPQGANLNEAIKQLFAVAKANVQAQIQQAVGDLALTTVPAPVMAGPTQQAFSQPSPNSPSNQSVRMASSKQLDFVRSLATKKGMSDTALFALIQQNTGKQDLSNLTSKEASNVIKALQ